MIPEPEAGSHWVDTECDEDNHIIVLGCGSHFSLEDDDGSSAVIFMNVDTQEYHSMSIRKWTLVMRPRKGAHE